MLVTADGKHLVWKDRVTDEEVRLRTGQQRTENVLRERRIHWLDHVILMDHQRIPQQSWHWKVLGFKR